MDWFSGVVLGLALLGAAATLCAYFLTGVPSLPTSPRVLGCLLVLLDRVPRRSIVDLGCGYGTLLVAAARRCPRAAVVGYEVSPVPYLCCRLRLWLSRLPNVAVRYGNLFEADLAAVDLVLCYLTRRPMRRLEEKLERELPYGAEVISHTFSLPGWQPLETVRSLDIYHTPVYRYSRPRPDTSKLRHPWLEAPAKKAAPPAGLLGAEP